MPNISTSIAPAHRAGAGVDATRHTSAGNAATGQAQVSTLAVPALVSGLLMALYLVLRPYGDADPGTTAQALASPWWVPAHVAGGLALAAAGWLAARAALVGVVAPANGGRSRLGGWSRVAERSRYGGWAQFARWAGPLGGALTLIAYGGEASALNAAGILAMAGQPEALQGVDIARSQPFGATVFAVGLALLAACGLALGVIGRRLGLGLAGWLVGGLLVLFVPQFMLPPAGRVTYGLVYFAAALALAYRVRMPLAASAARRPRR